MKILQENLRMRPLKIDDFGATRWNRHADLRNETKVLKMTNFVLK